MHHDPIKQGRSGANFYPEVPQLKSYSVTKSGEGGVISYHQRVHRSVKVNAKEV